MCRVSAGLLRGCLSLSLSLPRVGFSMYVLVPIYICTYICSTRRKGTLPTHIFLPPSFPPSRLDLAGPG